MRQSSWLVVLAFAVLNPTGLLSADEENVVEPVRHLLAQPHLSRGLCSRDTGHLCLTCSRHLDVHTADCCTDETIYASCVELLDEAVQSGLVPGSSGEGNSLWVSGNAEDEEEMSKRRSPFIGKRRSPFIGKRRSPFIGKRRSPFIGKRRSPFLGKRRSPFLGKRGSGGSDEEAEINLDSAAEKRRSPFLG